VAAGHSIDSTRWQAALQELLDRIAGRFADPAPPVDGKANAALLAFLAARLGLRPRDLRLAAGGSGRDKLVVIPGRTPSRSAPPWPAPAEPSGRRGPPSPPASTGADLPNPGPCQRFSGGRGLGGARGGSRAMSRRG
jgi:hypothetical protein